MRWLLAIAILGACGSDRLTVHAHVARGWEGKLDYLFGPSHCMPDTDERRLAPTDDHWLAIATGHARVPCADGAVELDILDPSRLAIAVPGAIGRTPVDATLAAYDGFGRELDLGDAAVTWTVTGAAAERWSGCTRHDDMDFLCGAIEVAVRRPAATHVVGTAHGVATVTAQFGGLVASRTLTVE
jgi:hypothetical protein